MSVNQVGGSGGTQTPGAQSLDAQKDIESSFKSALSAAMETAAGITDEQSDMAQPAMARFTPISYSPYNDNPYDKNPYDNNPYDSNTYDNNPYGTNPYESNPYGEQSDVADDSRASTTGLQGKLAKAVARYPALGDPYTFGPGERAKALVDWAVEAFPDLGVPLFDEVIFDPEIPTSPEDAKPVAEFSVAETGKRVITIRFGMFDQPLTRQVMIAIHELVHADQWRTALSDNEGDFSAAREQFAGVIPGSRAYALREIETESRALLLAESFLDSLPPEDVERSKRYVESWQKFLAASGGEGPSGPSAPVAYAEPPEFSAGSRSERAVALVNWALQGFSYRGVDLSYFVDRVVYDPAAQFASFWYDTETSERVITIAPGTFEKTVPGQLIAATHELIHAEAWKGELLMNNGNVIRTNIRFFISYDHPRYWIQEIQTERRALLMVHRLLGGLTPQQVAASTRYIESFQRALVEAGGQRVPDPPDWPWKGGRA